MAANELVNLSLDEIIARQDKFKKFGGAQRGRSRGARGGGFFRNGFRGRPIPTIGLVQVSTSIEPFAVLHFYVCSAFSVFLLLFWFTLKKKI